MEKLDKNLGGVKNMKTLPKAMFIVDPHKEDVYKRQVYLTMNTLPTNEEADRLPEAIKEAAKAGVDAFIVADLGRCV